MTPVDLANDTAGTPIVVGKNPQAIAMSPDGTTAWVVCYGSQTLVPLSTKTHRPGAAIHLPGGPYAIAMVSRFGLGPDIRPQRAGSGKKNKHKS